MLRASISVALEMRVFSHRLGGKMIRPRGTRRGFHRVAQGRSCRRTHAGLASATLFGQMEIIQGGALSDGHLGAGTHCVTGSGAAAAMVHPAG